METATKMNKLLVSAILIILASGCAITDLLPETPSTAAARRAAYAKIPMIPPLEFDHPYLGNLVVTRVETRADVQKVCGLDHPAMACAIPDAKFVYCKIFLVGDDVIAAGGITPEIAMRHEIGHCNGWPADHSGARPNNTPTATRDSIQAWCRLPFAEGQLG
jgi:hypothetical protein